MALRSFFIFLMLALPIGTTWAEESSDIVSLPSVFVSGFRPTEPASQTYETNDLKSAVPVDGGEALRALSGVSGVRMGGHGIDPVVRGQGQGRLKVLLDGAQVRGGCPNRMDPATSYAPVSTYDRVRVIHGGQTVLYGEGGSGGVILFEREPPKFEAGKYYRNSSLASFNSNGDQQSYTSDVALGSNDSFVRLSGNFGRGNNYQDGNGNTVRSAYQMLSGNSLIGIKPAEDVKLELGYEYAEAEDVLFPGALMDSPETSNNTVRTNLDWNPAYDILENVRLEFAWSEIDHLMDTYSLRDPVPGLPLRKAESDTKSSVARLLVNLNISDTPIVLGTDFHLADYVAFRRVGSTPEAVNRLQSTLWPDVEQDKWSVFAESETALSDDIVVKIGLRYDSVNRSADLADLNMPQSPNELYRLYYGDIDTEQREDNLGGFSRVEFNHNDSLSYLSFSRTLRTADQTEAFIASNGMTPMMRWVGNPGLNPEIYHRVEGGLISDTDEMTLHLKLFYDSVEDYILRDRARGQENILQSDQATIYRNIDAEFLGSELDLNLNILDSVKGSLSLGYVYANNRSENIAIAQIPPLEGRAGLEYARKDWSLGSQIRFAATQERVDLSPSTGSGLDVRQTPGYGVFDIFGRLNLSDSFSLHAGITNLFDKNYAEHLNKSNLFDSDQTQVNEPGRSVWLRAVANI